MKNGTEFSSEDMCLLLLARGHLSPEIQAKARDLLARDISWPRILERARAHGVLPLITRSLKGLEWPGVPTEVRAELEVAAGLTAARNALFVRALSRVLRCFGEVGVPVIPLKGVALAESLYGDVTVRACSDIDILVPRPFIPETFRLLRANGWEWGEEGEVDPADIGLLLRSKIDYTFVSRSDPAPLLLELHWDIAWRWRPDNSATDDLWADAERRKFWGVEAWALGSEWEILYLAVHAAHHRWRALQWIVDIHETCSHRAVNWERLIEKAKRFGWEDVLGVTLSICRALLGTSAPDHLCRRPLPPWLRVFPDSPAEPEFWQEALFATRLVGGFSAKLGYLGRLVFLPTIRERQLLSLPFPIDLLYYPMRPLRLASRWAAQRVRAAR